MKTLKSYQENPASKHIKHNKQKKIQLSYLDPIKLKAPNITMTQPHH